MADHRFDVRSKAQFKRDMKFNHSCEAEIAVRLAIFEKHKSGEWPALVPNGADFSGKFIEKAHLVTTDADFKIGKKLVEITRADVYCSRSFHIKCGKVKRCINESFDFVFVNGFMLEKEPKFIRLSPKLMEKFTTLSVDKYGEVLFIGRGKVGAIDKAAYRYDVDWFKGLWKPLPVMTKDIPKEYSDILNLAGVQNGSSSKKSRFQR